MIIISKRKICREKCALYVKFCKIWSIILIFFLQTMFINHLSRFFLEQSPFLLRLASLFCCSQINVIITHKNNDTTKIRPE